MKTTLALILFSVGVSSFVAADKTRTEAEAITLINRIYDELQKGAPFAQMVTAYSEDPGSVNTNGEFPEFPKGVLVKEVEERAWSLPIHEISKPFKSEFGYHIMEVLERVNEKVRFRHILILFKAE